MASGEACIEVVLGVWVFEDTWEAEVVGQAVGMKVVGAAVGNFPEVAVGKFLEVAVVEGVVGKVVGVTQVAVGKAAEEAVGEVVVAQEAVEEVVVVTGEVVDKVVEVE